MPRTSDSEIVQGYIEEVKTYIPSLLSGLEALSAAASGGQGLPPGSDTEVLEEIHRLAHTVKGASAMVGIYGLSQIAFQMEDALDEILAGNLVFTHETFQVMSGTVEHFQTYCRDFPERGVASQKLLRETVLAFRRLRNMPPREDENVLAKLLDRVPEYEGGAFEGEESREKDESPAQHRKPDIPDIKESFSVSDAPVLSELSELNEDEASLIAMLTDVPEPESDIIGETPGYFPEMSEDSVAGIPPGDENSVCPSALSPEFMESFYEEAEEHFQDMRVSLKILGSRVASPVPLSPSFREIIAQIRRSVRTLKGASSVLRLMNISVFSARAERFLDWLCESATEITPEIVSLLGESADLLESVVADPDREHKHKVRKLRAGYKDIMNRAGSGSAISPTFPEEESEILRFPFASARNDAETQVLASLQDAASLQKEAEKNFRTPGDKADAQNDRVSRVSAPAEACPGQALAGLDPELLASFYEEAEGHLQDMARLAGMLESQISVQHPVSPEHREILRQIRRSVHTLKGAAAAVGLSNVSSFAHSAEDLSDWLYESAADISPEEIALLAQSGDLLESLVADPGNARESEVRALREKLQAKTGAVGAGFGVRGTGSAESAPERSRDAEIAAETRHFAETHCSASLQPSPSKTLRVSMDRLDDMVSLAGELMIALSAFDQGMNAFRQAASDLDLARERLRNIARDMEIGYEGLSLISGSILRPILSMGGTPALMSAAAARAGASRTVVGLGNADSLLTSHLSLLPFSEFPEFDPLELDRYSRLNQIIRMLNESSADVGALVMLLANLGSEFDGNLTRQRVLLSELQDKMMRVRTAPMEAISSRLRRTVRELSAKLGKNIRFVIEGEDLELDREIWEKIADPLMHLLRNAADHGIEAPQQRQASGKPPTGLLKLSASREGNQAVFRISDDGSGIDTEAVRRAAFRLGISEKRAAEMSEEELFSLIFQPGFSTREQISEISGRGVGMDVVRQNTESLKGSIRVISALGKGTRFTLRVPMTLAVIRGLLFTAGGHKFALALNDLKEIIRISRNDIIPGPPQELVRIGEEIMPIYDAASLLNIRDGYGVRGTGAEEFSILTSHYFSLLTSSPLVLAVGAEERRAALIADTLEGQRELVIKSTGSHLRYVRGISGVTVMGDGSVVPILNIAELLDSEAGGQGTEAERASHFSLLTSSHFSLPPPPLQIMIVDDSVSIRQSIARLMEEQGWQVTAAKDGIDALEKLGARGIPDLIVLDIEMPRMNGYEFLNALRVQPAYREIPVIMLTSRAAGKHRDKAMGLGAKGYVIKPYNNEEFIALILQLTKR